MEEIYQTMFTKIVRSLFAFIGIISINTGNKNRGEFEKRLQNIIKEFISEAALFTILFLDEIHTLEGAR